MSPLQAPPRPSGPSTLWMRSSQAQVSQLAALHRLLHRHRVLRVRAQNHNKNSLDEMRDAIARRPVAQKAVLRLLLSPGLTGTLAVAGCYLAKMSSPLSALLTAPTATDVAIGLAAAVPLVALDALLLGPDYQPQQAPKRPGSLATPSPPSSGSAESSPAGEREESGREEERGSSVPAAATTTTSGDEREKETEEGGSTAAAAKEAEKEEEQPEKPKGPDAATVEAGRLALLRSLSASGVAVFDAGALAAGSSSSSPSGGSGPGGGASSLRRRLRAAAHAYSSRAVRSTLAREITGSPLAEAALVASARAGTELLARFFALRFLGGWVADRAVEAGGLAGEDALVSLLFLVRAAPDAPLGTAGEVLVLAGTAAGLVAIGVAGVVAVEAEAARAAAEVERRTSGSESSGTVEAAAAAAAATAAAAAAEPTSKAAAAAAAAATAAALERGGLAVMQQISRARADAALLDASLDALRLLAVGGAFVASGNHVAASLLATTVRELPFRRLLVSHSAERSAATRREAREAFEKLVENDEKFLALRKGMEERREKRALWLKRREELMGGGGGGGGGESGKRESGDDERGEGKDEV